MSEQKDSPTSPRPSQPGKSESQQSAEVVGSWEWNLDTNEVYWSDEVYLLHSLDPERFDGTFESIIGAGVLHEDDVGRVREHLQALAKTGKGGPIEYRVIRPDGTGSLIEAKAARVRLARGTQARVIGTVRDVTQMRHAEQRVRQREASLEAALRVGGLGHWEMDLEAGTVWSSEEVRTIAGIDAEVLTIQACFDLVHPEDLHLAETSFQAVLAGQVPPSFEYRLVRTDGSVRTVVGSVARLPKRGTVMGTMQDITDLRHAQDQLQQTQALLNAAIDQMPAALIVADESEGRIRRANSAALALKAQTNSKGEQLSLEEYASQWRMAHADGTPYQRSQLPLLRAVTAGETTHGLEMKIVGPDDGERWVEMHAAPVRDANGEIAAGIAIFPDVTERRQAERKLRNHAVRLEALSEITKAIIASHSSEEVAAAAAVWMLELSGCDQAAVWAFGRDDGDAVLLATTGKRVPGFELGVRVPRELFGSLDDDPRGRAFDESDLEALLGERPIAHLASAVGFNWMAGVPLLAGDELIGALGVSAQEPPVSVDACLQMLNDVAGPLAISMLQTQLQDKVRQQAERFQALIENALDAVCVLDRSSIIAYISPAVEAILGLRPEEVMGRSAFDLIHPEDRPSVVELFIERIVQPGSTGSVVARFQHRDGDWRWLEAIGHNRTDLPSVGGIVINIRDVSAQMRAEAEKQDLQARLQHSQKMEAIGRLAGGVAHDFNNLLTAIHGHVFLLSGRLPEDSAMRADLDQITHAVDRAAALTQQLLAFSRKQVLQPQVLELNDRVVDLEKMLTRLIGEHIELSLDLAPDLWRIRADPGQLDQVVVNLVVNARDAMPQGGQLRIRTRNELLGEDHPAAAELQPGQYVYLSVSDTGHGMDEATRARIFEPFFTTKALGQGTGLGLATVYGIVKQSDGHVLSHSRPGVGTTFDIYIPRQRGSTSEVEPFSEPRAPRAQGETILLVEDDDSVRTMGQRVLTNAGFKVITASRGDEALSLLDRQVGPIHLLLTDVIMPGASGRALAERVQAIHPETLVLYMSGYTRQIIAVQGQLERGVTLLEKPFTPAQLTRRVRDVLDGTVG